MSAKRDLAREIQALEDEIKELEGKRLRSMSSLLESVISKTEIGTDEARFFRTYTAEIEVKRERLVQLKKQLAELL
ncbi:MAG: hypothetical protein J1F71_05270 [Clostridiales bacterium]|nr:hypothetical protein [Clostridiales bacterium]